jgi:uncharacterized protein YbbC (DUF1343 family)
MKGWRRDMVWTDTGRKWVPPSPNLRSAEAAVAYPGVALLEATNVSAGRGTVEPFLYFGAPWVRPSDLRVTAPGFELEPVTFTPVASAAAPNPKFVDVECHGMRVRVTDPGSAEPYRLGVELLGALMSRDDFEFKRDGEALAWLLGTPGLLDDLRRRRTVDQIIEADRADHEAWRRERSSALLY